ncbi:MAG TPA: BrxA/BrxB family bacilliredoxin [Candidatus Sumerlaeota bacterium]|nr:MAG: hypothetical protein BWZ08_00936 [candidate division BRC1 bacterium ADurb.BinA292]HOE95952.1 BrxA/BrxB family bacilliredoxin [Candidatus Sumerlaeota bacterium]
MDSLYDREAVRPMWEELSYVGIEPLTTAEEVDAALGNAEGTALLVINSVCGCAAGGARPGATLSLQHTTIPDRLYTVFAGVDRAAVERARGYMPGIPPSSPFIALFKEGKPVFTLPRHQIEQMDAPAIARALAQAYDAHCSRQGPSVPREVFEKNVSVSQCGSTIPLAGPR